MKLLVLVSLGELIAVAIVGAGNLEPQPTPVCQAKWRNPPCQLPALLRVTTNLAFYQNLTNCQRTEPSTQRGLPLKGSLHGLHWENK